MAKRYHQSMHDRMDESRGMRKREIIDHMRDEFNDEYRHDKDGERGMYAHMREEVGVGPANRRSLEKDGMIYEDARAIANLPQEVMIRSYPRTGPYMPTALDDTIRGVDGQMDYDDNKRSKHFYPKKV